jgi:hypothetical protein
MQVTGIGSSRRDRSGLGRMVRNGPECGVKSISGDVVGGNVPESSLNARLVGLLKRVYHGAAVEVAVKLLRRGAIDSRTFAKFSRNGMLIVPKGFYAFADPDAITDKDAEQELDLPGIDFQAEAQRNLLSDVLSRFGPEYRSIPTTPVPKRPGIFYLGNGTFDNVDALSYYGLIRQFKPRHIIEVGAGHSTLLAARALQENGRGILTAIDPYPRPFLRALPSLELLVERAEDVDPDVYLHLTENDILFVDSSHVVRQHGDVEFLLRRILPRLRAGVFVHFHDIYLPFDYPPYLSRERLVFWNEQYLLQAYLADNPHVRVLFGSRYALRYLPELVKDVFPDPFNGDGVSFWLQKTG